jgi:hypothetical protein
MRDVIENGKSDEALSQIQKREIRRYILNDARVSGFKCDASLSIIIFCSFRKFHKSDTNTFFLYCISY